MFTNISAVLFDIDGTLLDTSEYIIQAFEHTLTQEGFDDAAQDRRKIQSIIGLPLMECYKTLTTSSDERSKHMASIHHEFQKEKLDLVVPFAGTRKSLETLKKAGLKIAACTTRSNKSMHSTLEHARIMDYFDVIICPEDTANHKPHPEPLLKALQVVDVLPQHAVMVGDSVVDIQAGKNAGTQTVRATYGINTDHLHNPEPDAFIDSIEALLPLLP
jgi:pyrophosphatase PpaX